MEEKVSSQSPLIDLEAIWQNLTEQAILSGPQILFAILILVVGNWLARMVANLTRRVLENRKIEPSLVGFLTAILHAALVTIIGAAGLAIGLALLGALSNFAAGVLIIIFKPYRAGDYVVAGGAEGLAEDISIFTTTLITLDNRTQIVPNAVATSDVIENYTEKGTLRVDLVDGVSYGDDIKRIKESCRIFWTMNRVF